MHAQRDHDFCLFAAHDPNTRRQIGAALAKHRSVLAGHLFGNRVDSKLAVQRRCRFELITESDINDYYLSEKLAQSMVAGCVRVYWGCSEATCIFPRDSFVDMRQFSDGDGMPDVEHAVAHCLTPGVYEHHRSVIGSHGLMEFLLNHMTRKHCMLKPMQRYLDRLRESGFCGQRETLCWRYWRLRRKVRRLLRRGS